MRGLVQSSKRFCKAIFFDAAASPVPWSALQRRGVKVNASHLRPGNVVEKSGRIYQVVESEHQQRGRGGAMMQIELRDVDSGSKQSMRFGVYVEEKTFTYMYTENETVYLMDFENSEQVEVPLGLFGKTGAYLKEEMKVKLQLYDSRPLSASIPKQATCTIAETPPYVKGASAIPRYKRALLDNGLTIQVPQYLEAGEVIIANTEDNSFVSKIKSFPREAQSEECKAAGNVALCITRREIYSFCITHFCSICICCICIE